MPNSDYEEVRDKINTAADAARGTLQSSGWWHSIDLGDGQVTPGVRGQQELGNLFSCFQLPEDLSGKRVLDIGCWDGYFSFEAERRGADVTAVDCWRPEKFFEAHSILKSRVEFHELSIYEVTRDRLGSFDIVFMLGVLYHLQHPLLGLQRVCEVTRDLALVESYVIDKSVGSQLPLMEFFEMDELGGQYDNWWGPNTDCMIRMLRAAGFVQTEIARREPTHTAIKASRRFPAQSIELAPSIRIVAAVNAITFQPQIPRIGRGAFLSIFAEGLPREFSQGEIHIIVGGFGALPCYVGEVGDADDGGRRIQINTPMPLGLDLGITNVQIRCKGHASNQTTIEAIEGGLW